MKTHYSVGCCCSASSICDRFLDNFNRDNGALGPDWETPTDWEISGNKATNSATISSLASESVAIHLPSETFANSDYVSAKVQGASDGDIAWLLVDADSENWHMVEVEFGANVCGGVMRLFKVTALSASQIGSDMTVNGLISGAEHDLALCLDSNPEGAVLRARVTTAGGDVSAMSEDTTTHGSNRGGRVGFGSDSVLGAGGVTFDDFRNTTLGDQLLPNLICPHCGVDCIIYEDDFDRATIGDCLWETSSGTFSISSNKLNCDSPGLITNLKRIPWSENDGRGHKATAVVNVPATGDRARVYVDYIDSSNNHYAEFEAGPGSQGTVRAYKMSGGVATQLSSDATFPNGFAGSDMTLTACINYEDEDDPQGAFMKAECSPAGGGTGASTGDVSVPHNGSQCALGADTANTTFDLFSFKQIPRGTGALAECEPCVIAADFECDNCEDSEIPNKIKVQLSGFVAQDSGDQCGITTHPYEPILPEDESCCEDMNMSHIIDWGPLNAATPDVSMCDADVDPNDGGCGYDVIYGPASNPITPSYVRSSGHLADCRQDIRVGWGLDNDNAKYYLAVELIWLNRVLNFGSFPFRTIRWCTISQWIKHLETTPPGS